MNLGEGDLICDLAETYGILNYRELSPVLVATLSVGLRNDSRVKMKISGQKITLEESLLATACDLLQLLNMPNKKSRRNYKSIYKSLTEENKKDELQVFNSVEEFESWYKDKMR